RYLSITLLALSPSLYPLFFFLRCPHPPRPPLFPYTTLFRSPHQLRRLDLVLRQVLAGNQPEDVEPAADLGAVDLDVFRLVPSERSEEHTSELQSRFDLVCRLLLEKKKKKKNIKNKCTYETYS